MTLWEGVLVAWLADGSTAGKCSNATSHGIREIRGRCKSTDVARCWPVEELHVVPKNILGSYRSTSGNGGTNARVLECSRWVLHLDLYARTPTHLKRSRVKNSEPPPPRPPPLDNDLLACWSKNLYKDSTSMVGSCLSLPQQRQAELMQGMYIGSTLSSILSRNVTGGPKRSSLSSWRKDWNWDPGAKGWGRARKGEPVRVTDNIVKSACV
jgi:hypothetical protein